MEELFAIIQQHLIDTVPQMKFVDMDLGQLEQEPLPSLSYPACLILFQDTQFASFGGRDKQDATVNIACRFAFRTFERTHNAVAPEFRAKGREHMKILDAAKWALQGLAGECFTPLMHVSFNTEQRADLRVYNLLFQTDLTVMRPNPQYVPIGEVNVGNTEPPTIITPTVRIIDEGIDLL